MQKLSEATDSELLDMSRDGVQEAFGELFRRYHSMALRIAAASSRTLDPEDVASEALTRIWSSLRSGGGPEFAFPPYLRTTVRNVASTLAIRVPEDAYEDDRLESTARHLRPREDDISSVYTDREVMHSAFNSLSERWRSVLWMVDVEGRSTKDVAASLGLTPNGAAALTRRARRALSRAWLQQHVGKTGSGAGCEWVSNRLSDYVRDSLTPAQTALVDQHLDGCTDCAAARSHLGHLARSMRSSMGAAPATASASRSLTDAQPASAAARCITEPRRPCDSRVPGPRA